MHSRSMLSCALLGTGLSCGDVNDPRCGECPDRPAHYTCPDCGMTSYNPNDAEHKYCGNCCKFEEAQEGEQSAN